MTEAIFTKYRLVWKFTNSGAKQESVFWLPDWETPEEHMKDLINLVELSASEYGFEYKLKAIDKRICRMVG